MAMVNKATSNGMPRIFDCFLFFNELDLLEIRMHETAHVVERFVITESTTTFSGQPKPLYFKENRARFRQFEDQITYIVVDTAGMTSSGWDRRRRQCDALKDGIVDATDDDIVVLSDLDEILSAETLSDLKASPPQRGEVICFELRMFNYFLNWELEERWLRSGPRAVRRDGLKTMERLRKVHGPSPQWRHDVLRAARAWRQMGRPVRRRLVKSAGWHFSYMGGVEAVQKKLTSYAAHDTVPAEYLNAERVQMLISAGVSISEMGGRILKYREIDDTFPTYLRNHREHFTHLIAPSTKST